MLGFQHESNYKFYDAKSLDGKHYVEVESALKGSKRAINAYADALLRKVRGISKQREDAVFHTIFVDARNTYQGGIHSNKFSGHGLYYKRGNGKYAHSKMHKVKNFAELKQLIKAEDHQLPEKAKGSLPSGAELKRLKIQAAKDAIYNKARGLARRAKAKAEGRNIYECQTCP